MKKLKQIISSAAATVFLVMTVFCVPASAWNASPENEVNMSLNLVGMMNVTIFQNSPTLSNVSTVTSGELSGKTLTCQKFGGTWPHQVGDGPYTSEQLASDFAADAITDCMTANEEEVAVYMLYDLGDPASETVQNNMKVLGVTDVNEYYKLMSKNVQICIDALPGGDTNHECAVTAYYRYSDDWRSFASTNSGKYVTRAALTELGIAAPNENRYFFETQESQKMIDGTDAFPGVFDESVSEYIDKKQSYSLPVWEDENEDASWNIINPVPTCSIYSRWNDNFLADSTYQYFYNIKREVIIEQYGEDYTDGEWNGYTADKKIYPGAIPTVGVATDVDNGVMPKNWEWAAIPYNSALNNGAYTLYETNKSHLGYGEYCPAGVTSAHWFYLPENTANSDEPGRFLTVMVRETGTMCGLDGCGHWHSVEVNGKSATTAVKFNPEITDDSVVIDYGMSVDIAVDANDWVWTTDDASGTAVPNIKDVRISSGSPDDDASFTTLPVNGKYGTLEIVSWANQWGDGNCIVRYTPKQFVNEPDVFYYKLYPNDTDNYTPIVGKISVVPATLVYYEDNFSSNDNNEASGYSPSIIYSGSWSYVDSNGNTITGKAVNGAQTNDNAHYGYDDYYALSQGFGDGSAHQGKRGDSMTFTFKGTGCDIIMRTDESDGSIRYSVTKSSINSDGTSGGENTEVTPKHTVSCRNNNSQTLYQLPVVSLRYDDYAYYTVTVDAVTSKNVYIDGIRIYNPLGVYGETGSDNAAMDEFYQAAEKNSLTAPVYNIVYDSSAQTSGDIGFLGVYSNWNEWYGNEKDENGNPADFSTLLSIGPNNEIYLSPGQSIVFNVINTELADLMLAVEAKALSGRANMGISVDGNSVSETATTVASNTAMYYSYDISASSIGSSATVRIANNGDAQLSVSNIKYSKILATQGKVSYSFVNTDGIPVSGVTVTLRDSAGNTVKSAVTDETGAFECDGLSLGKYKAYIEVPENLSTVQTRTVEVSEAVFGETQQFVLHYVNTTIGSHPSVYLSPCVTLDSTLGTASFENFRTETDSGSYEITYTFDGTAAGKPGYVSKDNFISGTLTVIVNSDGTASYKFTGSGKTGGKTLTSASGTTTSASFSTEKISIDYLSILKAIAVSSGVDVNKNFGFKAADITTLMPVGTSFDMTAYELSDASIIGNYGPAAQITVGEVPHYITDKTATVTYTFKDENGNPVPGVTATVNSVSAVSDESGVVTFTGVPFGSQTATFTPPDNLSKPEPDAFTTNPLNDVYSREFTLYPFDLTIGSKNPSLTPNAEVTTDSIIFSNLLPLTTPGSYKAEYVFTGTSGTNGYIDKDSFINGTLTLIVNSDGTLTYSLNGTGKNNKTTFPNMSGTISATVDNDFSSVSVNFLTLMKAMTGKTKDNDIKLTTAIFNSYADFTVTAYEEAGASGRNGNTETLAIGGGAAANGISLASIAQNIRSGLTEMAQALADRINAALSESEALGEIDTFLDNLGSRTEDEEETVFQTVVSRIVKFVETVTQYLRAIFSI